MTRILLFIVLMINWIIFSGRFDMFHLGLGVVSALLVTVLCDNMMFKHDRRSFGHRMHILVYGTFYSFWLLVEIIKANFHVLILSLHPQMSERIDPHIFRFKTQLKSDFARFVFANSITLTPGTVTLDIEGDEFIVHAIDKASAEELPGEMEQRVKKVFEPEASS